MPDPWQLPPAVYQGLGWSPAADPTQLSPVPALPGDQPGGLSPSIPQGMGWAPPPDAAPMAPQLPPTPTQLPSTADAVSSAPGASRDFSVPASAFGQGQQPAPPPMPAHTAPPRAPGPSPSARPPQGFDAQMANLQQREAGTEQAGQRAIDAKTEALGLLHGAQMEAFDKGDKTLRANDQERQAEADSFKKTIDTNTAQVAADKKAVEDWKFNRNKYMDELGVGGKIRWGIAQVLAGIGQGMMRQGGPNAVTQMLQQNIHDANEAQYRDRDALVQRLGFDRETGKDAATYHATRMAEIDKKDGLAFTMTSRMLEEAALKTADPMARAQGLEESAKLRAVADDKLKSYIQMKSQHDQTQQQIGIAGGHLALDRKKFDWEQNKEQQELDLKAAALLAKKDGKLTEEESKRAVFIPGPDGKPVPATRQDGTVVLAADPGDAGKIRRQVASTATYNALVGQMQRGMKEHGGESSWWHSKDWQDMKTDFKAAVAELHEAYGVQSFREPTIEFFDSMTSAGLDPTSFNKVRDNASEALANSNRNIQLKMNGLLAAQGYDRAPITWQDTSNPPAPTQTAEERVFSRGLVNPRRAFDKDPGVLATELGNFSSRGTLGLNETIDTRLKQEGGILPSVRQAMVTAGAALSSPDMAVRRHYYEVLDNIAKNSESPETADFAQQLLDKAMAQQVSATPGAANAPEATRGSAGSPVTR